MDGHFIYFENRRKYPFRVWHKNTQIKMFETITEAQEFIDSQSNKNDYVLTNADGSIL